MKNTVTFNDDSYNVEQSSIICISNYIDSYGWYLSIATENEEPYLDFRALDFNNTPFIKEIENKTFDFLSTSSDLAEHYIYHQNDQLFLDSLTLTFTGFNSDSQKIALIGKAISENININFELDCEYTGFQIISENGENDIFHQFSKLNIDKEDVVIEKVPAGHTGTFKGLV